MKFKIALLTPLLFISALLNAQTATEKEGNNIEGQFTTVIDGSNNYRDKNNGQNYKVIKIQKLTGLRKNILDTISGLETSILEKNNTIGTQAARITTLESTLGTTENNLSASKEKEDGIVLLGNLMPKSTYNAIMWSIIGVLLLGLAFFIMRFKNSNSVTKESKQKLDETEKEFEEYRQKKLEELQQTRRKLQDEINKNRS